MSEVPVLPDSILSTLAAADRSAVEGLAADAAVDVLHERNLVDLDDDRILATRDARVFAGHHLKSSDFTDTPPKRDDTPVELLFTEDGVPTVAQADLTLAVLTAAMDHAGCLLLTGVADPDDCARARELIDRAIAENPAAVDSSTAPNIGEIPISQFVRGWTHSQGGSITVDAPLMLSELIRLYTRAGVIDVATAFNRSRCALSAEKSYLRRWEGEGELDNGWHQDGAFIGAVRSLNAWLTFNDAGEAAPGMELLLRRMDKILTTEDGADFTWSLSNEQVLREANGSAIVAPKFNAGDCLIFDGQLVHRTYRIEGMTEARYSAETWFFAIEGMREDYNPILI